MKVKIGDRVRYNLVGKTGKVYRVDGPNAYVPNAIHVRFSRSWAVTLKPDEDWVKVS